MYQEMVAKCSGSGAGGWGVRKTQVPSLSSCEVLTLCLDVRIKGINTVSTELSARASPGGNALLGNYGEIGKEAVLEIPKTFSQYLNEEGK